MRDFNQNQSIKVLLVTTVMGAATAFLCITMDYDQLMCASLFSHPLLIIIIIIIIQVAVLHHNDYCPFPITEIIISIIFGSCPPE